MSFVNNYFKEFVDTLSNLNQQKIEDAAKLISRIRKNRGRIFILGIGGSAGNASHAVNDFRKLCNIECYSPTDNVSEITARTNDEGFETIFLEYLKVSKFSKKDMLLIFSVGGGNFKKKISLNLISAIKYANKKNAKVISLVGKNDGYAYKNSTLSILMSPNNKKLVTPISESLQVVIWHSLVSHPLLKKNKTKW
jgi:D-sedoheptulose 7-phosphate isomerase